MGCDRLTIRSLIRASTHLYRKTRRIERHVRTRGLATRCVSHEQSVQSAGKIHRICNLQSKKPSHVQGSSLAQERRGYSGLRSNGEGRVKIHRGFSIICRAYCGGIVSRDCFLPHLGGFRSPISRRFLFGLHSRLEPLYEFVQSDGRRYIGAAGSIHILDLQSENPRVLAFTHPL